MHTAFALVPLDSPTGEWAAVPEDFAPARIGGAGTVATQRTLSSFRPALRTGGKAPWRASSRRTRSAHPVGRWPPNSRPPDCWPTLANLGRCIAAHPTWGHVVATEAQLGGPTTAAVGSRPQSAGEDLARTGTGGATLRRSPYG